MRILFVADVFGAPGRRAVEERLPALREELAIDFCIVNGENAAAGRGITASSPTSCSRAAQTWSRSATGRGARRGSRRTSQEPTACCARRTCRRAHPAAGSRSLDGVAVINLLGSFALDPFESAFIAADRLVEEARSADAAS